MSETDLRLGGVESLDSVRAANQEISACCIAIKREIRSLVRLGRHKQLCSAGGKALSCWRSQLSETSARRLCEQYKKPL